MDVKGGAGQEMGGPECTTFSVCVASYAKLTLVRSQGVPVHSGGWTSSRVGGPASRTPLSSGKLSKSTIWGAK